MQDKTKWAVVLGVCFLLLLVAVVGLFTDDKDEAEAKNKPIVLRSHKPSLGQEQIQQHLQEAQQHVTLTHSEQVRAVIDEHREKVLGDPDSADAPGYLCAIANLYLHEIGDYQTAASYYRQVLDSYPDYEGRKQIYPQLATCYELADDHENKIRIYMEMMEVFPYGSSEYIFASDKLGLEKFEGVESAELWRQRVAEMKKEKESASEESASGEAEGELPQEEGETEGEPAPETATP